MAKTNKLKFDINDFQLKLGFTTNFNDYEPHDFVTHYIGKLNYFNPDSETYDIPVGRLVCKKIEIGRAINLNRDISEIFDSIDDELADYWTTLYDENANILPEIERILEPAMFGSDLLIIDRVEVLSKFRGHNLGLVMAQRAVEFLSSSCNFVAVRPFPLQFGSLGLTQKDGSPKKGYQTFSKDESIASKKLRSYWKTLGFIQINKTNIFLLNPSRKSPIKTEKLFKP